MSLKTVEQAIEWLNKTYGNDLEQPIFITTLDSTDIWEWEFDNERIENLNILEAKELPIDMVEAVFDNIGEWDKYWETTRDIVRTEVGEWLDKQDKKQAEQEAIDELEKQLWDTENKSEVKNNGS